LYQFPSSYFISFCSLSSCFSFPLLMKTKLYTQSFATPANLCWPAQVSSQNSPTFAPSGASKITPTTMLPSPSVIDELLRNRRLFLPPHSPVADSPTHLLAAILRSLVKFLLDAFIDPLYPQPFFSSRPLFLPLIGNPAIPLLLGPPPQRVWPFS